MKRLIINADDYGMSEEANEAITELLQLNKISSASLMANGAEYQSAVDIIKKFKFSCIGVHLVLTRDNFNCERPIMYEPVSNASTIVDASGRLYTSSKELLSHASLEDLLEECISQMNRIFESGIIPTHIDNHMYSIIPQFGIKGLCIVMKAYDLCLFCDQKCAIRLPKKMKYIENMYEIWCGRKNALITNVLLKFSNLKQIDYSYSFPFFARKCKSKDEKIHCLKTFFSHLPEGTSELHIHPCRYSPSLVESNPTWKHRVDEYEIFKSLDISQLLEETGIKLVSYNDI